MPETMIEQKRMVTMPPRTQVGASARKEPTGGKRPAKMSQKQQAKPAARLAALEALVWLALRTGATEAADASIDDE